MSNVLVTIPFSHFCEKARWALERAGIPFVEQGHPPLLHMPFARRAGGKRSVPVLRTHDGRVLDDSTDIVRFADASVPEASRLFGAGASPDVLALEAMFDDKLGPHARRLAYFHLLPRPDLMRTLLAERTSTWESQLVIRTLPLGASLMRRAMNIHAEGASRSLRALEDIFAEVDHRLADGRRFLVDDRFTAADLAFAALSTPVLMPPEAPVGFPALDHLPPLFANLVRKWRASRAGAHALRLYREERARVVAP